MEYSRQECWSGLPFPTPGNLPDPGIQPASLGSPALAGRLFFFTTMPAGKPGYVYYTYFKFSCIMMFWYLKKPFWLFMGEIALSGAIQFLDMARIQEHQTWFVWCKQTNPEPHSLSRAHKPPEAILLCLNHPRTRCHAAVHHPYSLEPAEIIQIS